jgi:hypothetical protein
VSGWTGAPFKRAAHVESAMTTPHTINRVYLIGAGASVPYDLPTMTDLSWQIAQILSTADRIIFLNAIRDCYGKDLQPNDGLDFEDLLNRLNPRALLYLEDTPILSADSSRQKAAEVALAAVYSTQVLSAAQSG